MIVRDRFGIKPVYYTTPFWPLNVDSVVQSSDIKDYQMCFKGVYKDPRTVEDMIQGLVSTTLCLAGMTAALLRREYPGATLDTFSISFKANFHKLSVTEQDLVDNFTVWHIDQSINNMNGVGRFLLSKYCRDLGCKWLLTVLREANKTTPGGFGAPNEDTRQLTLAKRLKTSKIILFTMDPSNNNKKSNTRWNGLSMQDHLSYWAALTDQNYYADVEGVEC
ncbi:hypothetical protein BC941DRAFT_472300 [Chlamydoabsidia padenii]|nr:hypothetical protein BC941DRAFT_472300 [Chlamydoabsidia padenii]